MRIIDTDNFGGDYPNEKFLPLPDLSEHDANTIVEILNAAAGDYASRCFRVVENNYQLQPGFEP